MEMNSRAPRAMSSSAYEDWATLTCGTPPDPRSDLHGWCVRPLTVIGQIRPCDGPQTAPALGLTARVSGTSEWRASLLDELVGLLGKRVGELAS
jgi:hypothetical protein